MSNFLIWHKTNFATLTTNEIKTLKTKMLKSPTMSMDIFNKVLGNIGENYPFSMSPKLILALLVLTGICTIVIGILFICYRRKTSFTSSTMGNLLKLKPSLKTRSLHWILCYPNYQNRHLHKILKMLLSMSLFLNYHKLHLMNLFCHTCWYQNYNWKNHQQIFLFHTMQPIWNQYLQLQLIINLNCYHWKCLTMLPLT